MKIICLGVLKHKKKFETDSFYKIIWLLISWNVYEARLSMSSALLILWSHQSSSPSLFITLFMLHNIYSFYKLNLHWRKWISLSFWSNLKSIFKCRCFYISWYSGVYACACRGTDAFWWSSSWRHSGWETFCYHKLGWGKNMLHILIVSLWCQVLSSCSPQHYGGTWSWE